MNTKALSETFGEGDASYQAAGQLPGLIKLVDAFYRYMDTLPEAKVIRNMHPSELQESRKKLAYFLSGWLGGPRLYREHYGPITIPGAHRHLKIGATERDAWMLCMKRALADQPYSDTFKSYLLEQLYVPAERIRLACQQAHK